MALLQTKLQVAGRGGKHFLFKCLRQRRARTLSPSPPRTVDKPQGRSISSSLMAAPLQTKLQVAGRGGKHCLFNIASNLPSQKAFFFKQSAENNLPLRASNMDAGQMPSG